LITGQECGAHSYAAFIRVSTLTTVVSFLFSASQREPFFLFVLRFVSIARAAFLEKFRWPIGASRENERKKQKGQSKISNGLVTKACRCKELGKLESSFLFLLLTGKNKG
jgi:hypothetical protein